MRTEQWHEVCCAESKTSYSDDCDGAQEGYYCVLSDVLACYTVRGKYNFATLPFNSRYCFRMLDYLA